MHKYNIYLSIPLSGRYELIKDHARPTGIQREDYWAECFAWEDLKKVLPFARKQGWKVKIEPIDYEDIFGKMHVFSFTCGVNHDVRILSIAGLRAIMARDLGFTHLAKNTLKPFGY